MINDFSKYGEAIKQLIAEVYNGQIIYEPVDTAFEYALNQTKNNLKFPFISFYHENAVDIDLSKTNFPSYKRGRLFEKAIAVRDDNNNITGEENKNISKSVQNLYITMRYIFDIWGTDRNSTNKLTQELLFWLFDNQTVVIKYFGEDLKFSFNVVPNLVDNTDLTKYHSDGKLYRMTLSISCDVALFRSTDYFNTITPVIDIEKI